MTGKKNKKAHKLPLGATKALKLLVLGIYYLKLSVVGLVSLGIQSKFLNCLKTVRGPLMVLIKLY